MVYVVIWLLAGIIAAIVAGNKNRSAVGWFFLTVLLTPLALLVLLALEKIEPTGAEAEQLAIASGLKACPMCAEHVQAAAKVCKHCRHEFADAPAAAVPDQVVL